MSDGNANSFERVYKCVLYINRYHTVQCLTSNIDYGLRFRALYPDFVRHMLICLQKCISNHEAKQSSKFQSDPSPIIASQLQFISYFLIFLFVSHLKKVLDSVLICDILGIGLF